MNEMIPFPLTLLSVDTTISDALPMGCDGGLVGVNVIVMTLCFAHNLEALLTLTAATC